MDRQEIKNALAQLAVDIETSIDIIRNATYDAQAAYIEFNNVRSSLRAAEKEAQHCLDIMSAFIRTMPTHI